MNKKLIILSSIYLILLIICLDKNIFWSKINNQSHDKEENRYGNKTYNDYEHPELTKDSYTYSPLWTKNMLGPVNSVAISSNGTYIAVGTMISLQNDGYLYLFNKSEPEEIWSYYHITRFLSVDISSDGNYIVGGTRHSNANNRGRALYFEKSSSNPKWNYDCYYSVESIAMSSDGKYVVAGTSVNPIIGPNRIYFFNGSNYANPYLWHYTTEDYVMAVDISADGKYIAAGSRDNKVYFFNRTNSSPLWIYETGDDITSLAMSSDGEYVAVGSLDNKLYLLNATNYANPYLWNYTTGGDVNSVSISSDGNYIVAGSSDKRIYLFNHENSQPIWSFLGMDDIMAVAISADGNYIIGSEFNIYMFHVSSPLLLWSYDPSGDKRIDTIAISSSGNNIVAGTTYQSPYQVLSFYWSSPAPFILSTNAGSPEIKGTFNLTWTESIGASNYSVYTYDDFISEINGSVNELATGIIDLNYTIYNLYSGDYYYKVAAFNNTGRILSNCIKISVDRNPKPFILTSTAGEPDYDGKFNLTWSNSIGAENYSVYVHDSYISEINGTVTELENGITDTKYNISNSYSGHYYYIVKAFNSSGTILSNCIHVLVDRNPGLFILSSNATNPDINGIFNLTWDVSENADNYSVYIDNSYINDISDATEIAHEIKDTHFLIEGLDDGVYYFAVMAYNESGYTLSNCIEVRVKLPPRMFLLSANPQNPIIGGNFILDWEVSLGAENYSVYEYHSYITEINSTLTKLTSGMITRTYPISRFSSGNYYYVVVAFNDVGNRSSNCYQVRVNIPPGPLELSSDAGSPEIDGAFNLNWNESKDAVNYSIYISSNYITEIEAGVIELISGIEDQYTYPISGLVSGKYYFVVVAYNETGNTTSNCIMVTVQIPPGVLYLDSNADILDINGIFNLTWSSSEGAMNYSVYVSSQFITVINTTTTELINGSTDLYYPIYNLYSGVYYYVIVAYNDTGYRLSNCIEITVQIPEYFLGFNTQYIFTWNITIVNETEMENVFGVNWRNYLDPGDSDTVGARLRSRTNSIIFENGWWKIYCDTSIWTMGIFDPYVEIEHEVAKDPLEFDDDDSSSYFIPIPVVNYFERVSLPQKYSIINNTIYIESIFFEMFTLVHIFNETLGVKEKYQIKNEDGEVIYEFKLIEVTIIEVTPSDGGGGGGGDGGDGGDSEVIPFGDYYLIFVLLAIITLIPYMKRKIRLIKI